MQVVLKEVMDQWALMPLESLERSGHEEAKLGFHVLAEDRGETDETGLLGRLSSLGNLTSYLPFISLNLYIVFQCPLRVHI